MNRNNNSFTMMAWKNILIKTQALAARYPCQGVSPDKLAQLPLDDLTGVYNHLKGLQG